MLNRVILNKRDAQVDIYITKRGDKHISLNLFEFSFTTNILVFGGKSLNWNLGKMGINKNAIQKIIPTINGISAEKET